MGCLTAPSLSLSISNNQPTACSPLPGPCRPEPALLHQALHYPCQTTSQQPAAPCQAPAGQSLPYCTKPCIIHVKQPANSLQHPASPALLHQALHYPCQTTS